MPPEVRELGRAVMSAITAEVYMEEGVGQLEPRVARIETDVAGLKATVTQLDKKVDRVEEKVDRLEERVDEKIDRLDEKVNARFDGINTQMAAMGRDIENLKTNYGTLHTDMHQLRGSLDAKFIWIVTTVIAFGSAMLLTMAKGFGWLK